MNSQLNRCHDAELRRPPRWLAFEAVVRSSVAMHGLFSFEPACYKNCNSKAERDLDSQYLGL